MSWSFLFSSLVFGFAVYCGYRPLKSARALARVALLAGFTASELALPLLASQVLVAGFFVTAGALAHAPGGIALGVALASLVATAVLAWNATRTTERIETGLRAALGIDYPGRMLAEVDVTRADDELSPLQLVLPISRRPASVERLRNICFAHGQDGRDVHLDILRQREPLVGCPVLLQINGVNWLPGSRNTRRSALPLQYRLAEHGWVCVSVEHRLAPDAAFPESLIDAKRALCWVKDTIARYGGDPEFIVATGTSAGAHLSALLALTADEPEYQPGFESADTRIQACVAVNGVYDLMPRSDSFDPRDRSALRLALEDAMLAPTETRSLEALGLASPMSRARTDAPPFFVLHGSADVVIPAAEARTFAEQLSQKSHAPVAYAELPGAHHGFTRLPTQRGALAIQGVHRFLNSIYSDFLRNRNRETRLGEYL